MQSSKNEMGQPEGCPKQSVEKPVIASQSADWRGNPFSKMFCFYLGKL